ncbi:ABC transporter ATP-binding protein [Pontibacter diazotrophicus]|uniref:ABC transporter ATP-binding protein n=2 Tax=Pontibacter diazotrophicus TaxID=1400979 RepID=A0A3D8L907_9BACT|nr:ABC transporter ATP-binding protein [Pontibacter diazotrophicus]
MLAAAALLLAPLGIANAQSDGEVPSMDKSYDRVLKVYPLQLSEVYLAYEKMRTDRISNELGLSYIYSVYMKGDASSPESQPVQGASVRMSQRRYTLKNEGQPFGFFHGPFFGYRFLAYEQDVFEQLTQTPDAPTYHGVGHLYQHSLDLSYQLGIQFNLMGLLTADVAASLGGRVKYALANNAGELLTDHIIGHAVIAENNSAIFAVPLPQLNLSVGYAF